MAEFERQIGRRTIGNKPASGTEIIKELGEEHVRTGFPIVYTSGDSVFQIAAHEDVIPIAELYRMCEIARKMLDGPEPRGARDRAAVCGHGWEFPAHRAAARLCGGAAAADAAGRAGGAGRAGVRRGEDSRYLQWARGGGLRHYEEQR